MMNRNVLNLIVKYFFLIFLIAIIAVGCENDDNRREREEMNMRLDSLSTALKEQQQKADSLQQLMQKGALADEYTVMFGRKYDSIDNPREFIKNALREQPELIPLDPVLGGTMDYRNIKILTEDWVIATYDDGHVQGKTIFRYNLRQDGRMEFTPVVSHRPAPEEEEIPYDRQ